MTDILSPSLSVPCNSLNIPYLQRFWYRSIEAGTKHIPDDGNWDLDNTLLSGLGLNLLETARFLHNIPSPSFDTFERWILQVNGGSIDEMELKRLHDALAGLQVGSACGDLKDVPGLTSEELSFWAEHGYVVVHDAVGVADRKAAEVAIYEVLDADPTEPATWYNEKYRSSIWTPLLHHPAFAANRRSPRLVKAFTQLWGREDLWPVIDHGGFNPPEREGWSFPGPQVHWDMTLAPPHCFRIQGILYLTDTSAEQGAFRCIPDFHLSLESWLKELQDGEDPRQAILSEPGLTPIAGKAGDLILWNQLLPHASSPNHGALPRVVQYITLQPTRWTYTAEWR